MTLAAGHKAWPSASFRLRNPHLDIVREPIYSLLSFLDSDLNKIFSDLKTTAIGYFNDDGFNFLWLWDLKLLGVLKRVGSLGL